MSMNVEAGRKGFVSRPLADRFWERVEKSDGCWVWMGTTDGKRYGSIWDGQRSRKAHRVSWEMANGPIPPGLEVCHRCDSPPCVRPDHLFLGTHKENMHDSIAKGRKKDTPSFGDANGARTRPDRHLEAVRRGGATRRSRPNCKRGHPKATYLLKDGGCRACKTALQREAREFRRRARALSPPSTTDTSRELSDEQKAALERLRAIGTTAGALVGGKEDHRSTTDTRGDEREDRPKCSHCGRTYSQSACAKHGRPVTDTKESTK